MHACNAFYAGAILVFTLFSMLPSMMPSIQYSKLLYCIVMLLSCSTAVYLRSSSLASPIHYPHLTHSYHILLPTILPPPYLLHTVYTQYFTLPLYEYTSTCSTLLYCNYSLLHLCSICYLLPVTLLSWSQSPHKSLIRHWGSQIENSPSCRRQYSSVGNTLAITHPPPSSIPPTPRQKQKTSPRNAPKQNHTPLFRYLRILRVSPCSTNCRTISA